MCLCISLLSLFKMLSSWIQTLVSSSLPLQALPGSAGQLTALTIRPLPGQPPPSVRWAHVTHLRSLSSLVLTASDFGQQAGPTTGLAQLSLTRLRLHGAQGHAAGLPAGPPEVGPALLACPPALQRLELAAVRLLCSEEGPGAPWHAESTSSEEDSSEESSDGHSSRSDDDIDDDAPLAAVAAGAGGAPQAAGNGLGQLAAADGAPNAVAEPLAEPPLAQAGHAVAVPPAAAAAAAPAPAAAAAGGPAFGAAQQAPWQLHEGGHLWMPGQGQQLAAGLRERWQRLEVLRLHNVDVSREVLKGLRAGRHTRFGGMVWVRSQPGGCLQHAAAPAAICWLHLDLVPVNTHPVALRWNPRGLAVLPSLPCLTSLHLAPRFGASEAILEAQRCNALQVSSTRALRRPW